MKREPLQPPYQFYTFQRVSLFAGFYQGLRYFGVPKKVNSSVENPIVHHGLYTVVSMNVCPPPSPPPQTVRRVEGEHLYLTSRSTWEDFPGRWSFSFFGQAGLTTVESCDQAGQLPTGRARPCEDVRQMGLDLLRGTPKMASVFLLVSLSKPNKRRCLRFSFWVPFQSQTE